MGKKSLVWLVEIPTRTCLEIALVEMMETNETVLASGCVLSARWVHGDSRI
jgi:hypothetical protein